MKRTILAPLALALAACAPATTTAAPTATLSPIPPAAAASTAAATSATPSPSSAAPSSTKNARGNIVKKVGEPAYITSMGNQTKPVVTYVVKSITPNFKCTSQYATKSEHGNFIAVELDVTTATADEMKAVGLTDAAFLSWKVIGPDGTTENSLVSGAAIGCVDQAKRLPMSIGPGEHVVGTVILDAKNASGAVVMGLLVDSSFGWEYSF